MNSILDAQQDMRHAYLDGVPGVICSGTAWIIAGLVALFIGPQNGIYTLIFGGMLIFPASVLLCKVLGRSGKHQQDNPLASLAIEGTFWMLLSIPVAVAAAFFKIELFFPAMMLVIAGRYLTFNTLYGSKMFWIFSLALVAAAMPLAMFNAPAYVGALAGGLIEILFGLVIFIGAKKRI